MKKIRVEYGTEDDFRYKMLTDDEVIGAFIEEFSSKEKTAEEIVLDIFRAIDPAVTEIELELIEKAVKDLVKKRSDITEIVQKVLAPADKLAQEWKEVVLNYCRRLDNDF